MTNNNLGRRFSLSGSGEALFWLSFFPDEIGTGPGLKFDLFLLKHVLMPWTAVAIAIGVGLTGRGLPRPWLAQRSAHPSPRPHGDTPGKAVPRIAIKREHPDEISTKLSISCFVAHYRIPRRLEACRRRCSRYGGEGAGSGVFPRNKGKTYSLATKKSSACTMRSLETTCRW